MYWISWSAILYSLLPNLFFFNVAAAPVVANKLYRGVLDGEGCDNTLLTPSKRDKHTDQSSDFGSRRYSKGEIRPKIGNFRYSSDIRLVLPDL